jgi:hypothetical protein
MNSAIPGHAIRNEIGQGETYFGFLPVESMKILILFLLWEKEPSDDKIKTGYVSCQEGKPVLIANVFRLPG